MADVRNRRSQGVGHANVCTKLWRGLLLPLYLKLSVTVVLIHGIFLIAFTSTNLRLIRTRHHAFPHTRDQMARFQANFDVRFPAGGVQEGASARWAGDELCSTEL